MIQVTEKPLRKVKVKDLETWKNEKRIFIIYDNEKINKELKEKMSLIFLR